MRAYEIQPNILGIVQGVALLASVQSRVIVDDGLQAKPMEEGLKTDGIAVLIMQPIGAGVPFATKGAVSVVYSTSVWIRTNPKMKDDQGAAKWDPLEIEDQVLTAAMKFSRARTDFGFAMTEGPEQDYTDMGNNSRLVFLETKVDYN